MITSLVTLLIVVIVAYVVWRYAFGAFIKDGTVMNLIGLIIGLALLLYAARLFGFRLP